jgi:hypothetical protein
MPLHRAVSGTPAGDERRCSERFPVDDEAEVEVSGDSPFTLSGFMRDVSQMGLRLALPERVSPGAKVRISVRGGSTRLTGEVRYCRSAGDIYYAGVAVHTILKPIGEPQTSFVQPA